MIKVFDDMEIRAKVNLGTEEAPIWREVEVLTGAYPASKVRILNRQGQPYNAATIIKMAIKQNLVDTGKIAPGDGYTPKKSL